MAFPRRAMMPAGIILNAHPSPARVCLLAIQAGPAPPFEDHPMSKHLVTMANTDRRGAHLPGAIKRRAASFQAAAPGAAAAPLSARQARRAAKHSKP